MEPCDQLFAAASSFTVAASVFTLAGSPALAASASSWEASRLSASLRSPADNCSALVNASRVDSILLEDSPFDRSS